MHFRPGCTVFFNAEKLSQIDQLFTLPQIGPGPFEIISIITIPNTCSCESENGSHLPLCNQTRIAALKIDRLLTIRNQRGLTRTLPANLFTNNIAASASATLPS